MNSKGYLDISFSWIFAILVGGLIIFGAIYGLNKFVSVTEKKNSVETGTEFESLLSSLETDVESAKVILISFPIETRIKNDCSLTATFGKQGFSISQKINNRWSDMNTLGISSRDNYVFSKSTIEGKNFYSFSKPLELPFKVADLIYLFPEEDKYCFSGNFNREIEDELEPLNHPNLLIENCDRTRDVIEVCFSGGENCDIEVDYRNGIVEKNGKELHFLGNALMYAAIFSDERNYECEIKRLLYRAESLAEIYHEKGLALSVRGCQSPIVSELASFKSKLSQIDGEEDLYLLVSDINRIEIGNKFTECKLW